MILARLLQNAIAARTSKQLLFRLVTCGPPGHLALAPGAATDLSPLHREDFSDPLESAEIFLARLSNVSKHTETYRRLQALVGVKKQQAEAKARMDALNEQARREMERLREQGSAPVLPLAMLQQWQSAENSLRLLETVAQEAQETVDRATYDEINNPREALPCPRSLANLGDVFWHGYPGDDSHCPCFPLAHSNTSLQNRDLRGRVPLHHAHRKDLQARPGRRGPLQASLLAMFLVMPCPSN
jgi:hypothetical protein